MPFSLLTSFVPPGSVEEPGVPTVIQLGGFEAPENEDEPLGMLGPVPLLICGTGTGEIDRLGRWIGTCAGPLLEKL